MKRFVDLRPADIAGCRFAFWCTVEGRFEEFYGDAAWGTFTHFMQSCYLGNADQHLVDRLAALIPAEFLEPYDMMADETEWKVVEDV